MKLRTCILLFSGAIVTGVMGLFYFQANALLGGKVRELEAIHLRSVKEYTGSLLEARRYLLAAYSEEINKSNELSRLYLLARRPDAKTKVAAMLKQIHEKTKCDVVDVLGAFDGNPFGPWRDENSKSLLKEIAKGRTLTRVVSNANGLWMVVYFPLRLFQDVVGMGVLGYELNGKISREVSDATNARVTFVPTQSREKGILASIPIEGGVSAQIVMESDFISAFGRDISGQILFSGLTSLLIVVVILYIVLNGAFVKGFQSVLSEIHFAASELDKNSISVPQPRKFPISEVTLLSQAFSKFSDSTREFHERVQRKTRTEAMGEKAAQVAHDLKGPIQALSMALDSESLQSLSDSKREAVKGVLNRIRNIANTVKEGVGEIKGTVQPAPRVAVPTELSQQIDAIVAEKTFQYRDLPKVSLLIETPEEGGSFFAKIDPRELSRILSNLIDNAVQSIEDSGSVTLRLVTAGDKVLIEVADTGRGIPSEILPNIGERGFSYGKKNGSGLGVWHARETVSSWGGNLAIRSAPSLGSTITIELPQAVAPSWGVSELSIRKGTLVVILDDDATIHSMWKDRFSALEKSVTVKHFESAEELVLWFVKEGKFKESVTFLFDYELSGQAWTGLQIIEELEIEENAILVTGHSEDQEVQDSCARLGIRLIPKERASVVPIRITRAGNSKKRREK